MTGEDTEPETTDRKTEISLLDDEDEVVCRECNERLGQITTSHLSLHGITMQEYRDRYQDAPVQSETVKAESGWGGQTHGQETKNRISESISEKHKNGDYNHANEG